MVPRDQYPDDSELGGEPPPTVIHNHYSQSKNGNGDVNKIVWGIAAFAVICLVTINGVMWSKLWTMSETMTRLETQMAIVLQRLPQP